MPVMMTFRIIPEPGSNLEKLMNRSLRHGGDFGNRHLEEAFRQTEVGQICEQHAIHWRVSPIGRDLIEVRPMDDVQATKLRLYG